MLNYKIGHTHGLEESLLLLLVGHQHHFLPLAFHSNLNPNRLLCPMPTPSRGTTHQPFPTLHIYLQDEFLHIHILKEETGVANLFVACLFSISDVEESTFQYASNTLEVSDCFVEFGDSFLSTYNNMPYIRHCFPTRDEKYKNQTKREPTPKASAYTEL